MTLPSVELASGDAVAARALRLVDDGAVDRHGVDGVAKKVGVSPRHVLRAVEAIADCGPLDLARAGRVRLARLLLTTTAIPMRDVAVAAGFSSVRQFNSTIMAMYRCTPGTIRFGLRRVVIAEREPGPLVVRCVLALPQLVGAGVFAAMAERLIPEVEEGTDRWFARTVRLPRGAGHMRVDLDAAGRLHAKLTCTDLRDFAPLMYRVEQLFTAPASAAPAPVDVAVRPTSGATDMSESLIRAMVERHSSAHSGRTVLGGLVSALGEITPWGLLFPTARAIADEGRTVLRGPTSRVDSVMHAAQAIADGVIDVDAGWSRAALMARHSAVLAV
ncbi:MAG: helix-turn-helix domain-containing protein [Nakamurella sp.]